jgi:hypothetical protein
VLLEWQWHCYCSVYKADGFFIMVQVDSGSGGIGITRGRGGMTTAMVGVEEEDGGYGERSGDGGLVTRVWGLG